MPWLGRRRIAFIPVRRTQSVPPEPPPPGDFADQILKIALYNPVSLSQAADTALVGMPDQSLRGFIRAASSGRADIDAVVLPMQLSEARATEVTEFEPALGSSLRAQGFDHAVIVTRSGPGASNAGFWSRVLLNEHPGRWMMEIIHGLTGFPDLYPFDNDVDPGDRAPGNFDEMANSVLTHPTIFTKQRLGWADAASIAALATPVATYDLQIGALAQPPAGGRVAAVQIGKGQPHVMVEARTKADGYDVSIASQGVIAYRVQWEDPVLGERPGHHLPLYMLTPKALQPGESATLDDGVVLTVNAAVPAGFSVTLSNPNVHHLDRTALTGAKAAAGPPTAIVLDSAGIDDIAYRDGSGHLCEIWRDPQRFGQTDLTAIAAPSAPVAHGDPHFYFDPSGGQFILLFRGKDDQIHDFYWLTGAVGHDRLSDGAPKAAGDPTGWFSTHDQTHHAVYVAAGAHHLTELSWQGAGAVSHRDLSAAAGIAGASAPRAIYDAARGTNIIVFRAADGHVGSLYWQDGVVGHDRLSEAAGTPKASGDVFAWRAEADDSQHVVYRAANGHIYEIGWVGEGAVVGRDLTALAGLPTTTGEVTGGDNAADNTHHVIARGADGKLWEVWWFAGASEVGRSALSAEYGGPPAVDTPVYFSTAGAPHQHVCFRAADGHIHELLW